MTLINFWFPRQHLITGNTSPLPPEGQPPACPPAAARQLRGLRPGGAGPHRPCRPGRRPGPPQPLRRPARGKREQVCWTFPARTGQPGGFTKHMSVHTLTQVVRFQPGEPGGQKPQMEAGHLLSVSALERRVLARAVLNGQDFSCLRPPLG